MNERTLKFTTECQNCVFYKQKCELSRLEKFRAQGLVTEGIPVINTICNTKRDSIWADQFNSENLETRVMDECKFQTDFIILSYDDENVEAKIMQTVKQCLKQELLPKSIIVVAKNDSIPRLQELYSDLHNMLNIAFCFIRIVGSKTRYECIDEAFVKVGSPYYTVWETSKDIPVDFNSKINTYINVDLKRFIMLEFDGIHGLTTQSIMHKYLGGHHNVGLPEVIKTLSNEQNASMVINYEEL